MKLEDYEDEYEDECEAGMDEDESESFRFPDNMSGERFDPHFDRAWICGREIPGLDGSGSDMSFEDYWPEDMELHEAAERIMDALDGFYGARHVEPTSEDIAESLICAADSRFRDAGDEDIPDVYLSAFRTYGAYYGIEREDEGFGPQA